MNKRQIKKATKKYFVDGRRYRLPEMPYDKEFNGELCHATGYSVYFVKEYGNFWMNEYVDRDGTLHYGN